MRSTFAGAFPMFVGPLIHKVGISYGITIFACFGTLLIPVPFLFFRYGKQIRDRNAWSRESETGVSAEP